MCRDMQVASATAAAAAVAHSRNRSFSGLAQPGAGVNANELSDALATVEHSQGSPLWTFIGSSSRNACDRGSETVCDSAVSQLILTHYGLADSVAAKSELADATLDTDDLELVCISRHLHCICSCVFSHVSPKVERRMHASDLESLLALAGAGYGHAPGHASAARQQ